MQDLIIIVLILFIYRGRDEFMHKTRQTILRLKSSINLFDITLTVNLNKTLLQQISSTSLNSSKIWLYSKV